MPEWGGVVLVGAALPMLCVCVWGLSVSRFPPRLPTKMPSRFGQGGHLAPPPSFQSPGQDHTKGSIYCCLQLQLLWASSSCLLLPENVSVTMHRGCLDTPHCTWEPPGHRIKFSQQTGTVFLACDSDYK